MTFKVNRSETVSETPTNILTDHIVTMVSNLNHMEKILSRSHANYLAQINIKMNERQEATADVLGKLTVLGTIVRSFFLSLLRLLLNIKHRCCP